MLAGLALSAVSATEAASAATVPGNVTSWAIPANKTGTAPDSLTVDIAVHMVLRNAEGLRHFVDAVSKPGNPMYGHYLSKSQFQADFAPDLADVEAVRDLLQKAGMTEIAIGPARAYVTARATVAQLRSTFAVTQDLYTHGTRTLRANREAPTIPERLAGKVLFIEGLDDTPGLRHPMHRSATQGELHAPAGFVRAPDGVTPATITPPPVASNDPSPYCSSYFGDHKAVLSTRPAPYGATEPWLQCGYTPTQIRQAYGLDKVGYDGKGVTVAIIDAYASPTLTADGNRFAANHGLPALTSANFTLDVPAGIYSVNPNDSCGPYGWWTEENLDLGSVHGSAPGANILYVGAASCAAPLTEALLKVIYDKEADVITNSYGYNGESVGAGTINLLDQAAEAAGAMGETLLFSSGDDGDLSQVNGIATGAYESTSPYVTGVGGTSLALYGALGDKDEWGWGNNRDYLANATVNSATSITTSGLTTVTNFGVTYSDFTFYHGSGGGISLAEVQPSYQVGVVPHLLSITLNNALGGSTTLVHNMRVSPDVAMDADPYTGYLYGQTFTTAGNFNDTGCIAISPSREYCEIAEGGTSLASPLMAGMIAVVDQAHLATKRPLVGFANPWLYGTKPGTTLNSAGINDVTAPKFPVALLRAYVNPADASLVRLVTINSVPFDIYTSPAAVEVCGITLCEGIDDVFNYTKKGYDDVTGLGVPYAPKLIMQ
jgi:subtilase family serine protease